MAKKITQNDLRRLMSQKKSDILQIAKKVDSPLAKYKEGQLWCIVCDNIVRSDAVWPIHINSKKHKDNIGKKKSTVVPPVNVQSNGFSLKRPASTPVAPLPTPPKQIKSILKNSTAPKPPDLKPPVSSSAIPNDFFDSVSTPYKPPSLGHLSLPQSSTHLTSHAAMELDITTPVEKEEDTTEPPLPEGFFDDPILDAKARNIEYKDPIEEEWEKFQKELKEEATVSAQIIAEDQEEAVTDRQIVEIDEQLKNWERVLELEVKKEKVKEMKTEEVKLKQKQKKNDTDEEMEDEDMDQGGFDEFLSWRAKKSFK
uniref:Zinc finger protein 830 n=1 Tax=Cacopsylla melanoneura TaxID=428564 RepID=A0A8D9FG71_9HEMI